MENLESFEILWLNFRDQESHETEVWVMESHRKTKYAFWE